MDQPKREITEEEFREFAKKLAKEPEHNALHDHDLKQSPAGVSDTEDGERLPSTMNFSWALDHLKHGRRVARLGWNGKNQFVVMMPELQLPPYNTQDTARKVNDRTAKWIGEDQPLNCRPYLALYSAQKEWQPGWVPSQGDLFAEDWIAID